MAVCSTIDTNTNCFSLFLCLLIPTNDFMLLFDYVKTNWLFQEFIM